MHNLTREDAFGHRELWWTGWQVKKKKTCQVPIENLENQIDGNLAIMKWEGEGEYELVHKFFFYLDGLVVFFN